MKNNTNFLKKLTVLIALMGAALPVSAQINPAKTIDFILPGGPYSNVENTGAAITECSSCAQGVAHAYTWDGDNPGIAVYEPGMGVFVQPLPSGSWDPDIVFGLDGTSGVVVNEKGTGIEFRTFTYSPGVLTLSTPKLVHANAHHPNIDNPTDSISRDPVVIVFETSVGSSDLKYAEGTLTGGFGTSLGVLKTGLTQGATILNRFRPDVQVYDDQKYLFVAQGIDSITGNDCIDLFDYSTFLNGFSLGNILLSGIIAHPRIDGVVDQVGLTYAYSVTYKDHNSIRHGMQSAAVTALQPTGSASGKPAIAYSGDYHDAVWPTDAVAAPNYDLIGKGFFASTPDTFYKELNEVSTSGVMDKWAVSIAGLVNFDYAACWATTEDFYYKEATVASANYKKQNQVTEIFEIAVYSTSGQMIKKGNSQEIKILLSELPSGLYVIIKKNNFNEIIEVQKIIK
jgi:hypothetical protein